MSYILVNNGDGTSSLVHADEDGAYLAHHGIKGQRWGVRRFQNPDGSLTSVGAKRRQYQITLNDLDKRATKIMANYMRYSKSVGKGVAKTEKLKAKYKNNKNEKNKEKLLKAAKKADAAMTKRDKAAEDLKKIDSNIWKTVGATATSGYNVRSKPVYRNHDKALTAATYAFGIPGAVAKTAYNNAVYAPRYGGQTPSHVNGNKWKVTKQKRK